MLFFSFFGRLEVFELQSERHQWSRLSGDGLTKATLSPIPLASGRSHSFDDEDVNVAGNYETHFIGDIPFLQRR